MLPVCSDHPPVPNPWQLLVCSQSLYILFQMSLKKKKTCVFIMKYFDQKNTETTVTILHNHHSDKQIS